MKKITVALEDEVYIRSIDCVAGKSEKESSRLSVSGSANEPIAGALADTPWEEELEAR
jgi:hypothetical protein